MHGAVHGDDFERARADAEQAGKRTRDEHDAKAGANISCAICLAFAVDRIVAVEPQARGQSIRRRGSSGFGSGFEQRLIRGLNQDQAEDNGQSMRADAPHKNGAGHCAQRGGDLKKHADADVGKTLAHIGCRGARRCGDDGNQRSADRIFHVDAEGQGKRGHHDHSAAEAGERAQKARERGERPNHDGEFEGRHRVNRFS